MRTDKETGSYYTPVELVQFMIRYLKKRKQNFSCVLEPSVGDGRFLSALLPISGEVRAVELFEKKVEDVRARFQSEKLEVMKCDFLEYAMQSSNKYSLIIGNPPYISPKVMEKEELELAKQLCEREGLQRSVMQNMWLAFVIGATRLLDQDGSIFFVLPAEFLQVQYAEKLRVHLEKMFNVIHIITFRERIFPEIDQEVCLVYLANGKKRVPYILYETYQNALSTKSVFRNEIKKNKPLKKWSNAVLLDEDILLLKKMSAKYKKIEEMGESAPGIVTGGNKFFILTEKQVREYDCMKYTLPILQKSSYVNENTIIIDEDTIDDLKKKNRPMFLLNLSKIEEKLPSKLKKYLDKIKDEKVGEVKLSQRYKCANRTPWYGVPIVNKGDIIFFKRYHVVPRVYVNRADIHTTDAGYHIRLNKGWDKDSFAFCFYNSLTLAQCEFQGRYYGGGVSELIPSEFKELPVPYYKIAKEDIELLNQMFQKKQVIEDIVSFVNSKTISKNMDLDTVMGLEQIRKTLVKRRISRSV